MVIAAFGELNFEAQRKADNFACRAIAFQQKHARPRITIANSIQTNGVLLGEQWCQFLAQNRWPVGISIDCPAVAPPQPCAQHKDHLSIAPGYRIRSGRTMREA